MSILAAVLLGTLVSLPINMAVNSAMPEKVLVCEQQQQEQGKMICHWEKK